MWSNYSGNSTGTSDLEVRKVNKIFHLSLHAHVVHTAAKQVIWRRGKNEKVCEMSKNEKMDVQSVQNYCFSLSNMQNCDVLVAVVVVRFDSLFAQ